MPLCRCSSFYQLTKLSTQARASSSVENSFSGHAGTYFSVLNSDSTCALSLLTRGWLWEAVIFNSSSFTCSTCDFMGAPLSSSMETTFVLDVLEQASWARRPTGTIHHSDKRSQYVSLAYTQRLKDAELLASTGSTGNSCDNAMAESINGLYKAEVIHRQSRKTRSEVELATLAWVEWYNNRRLPERLGHIPPAEAEDAYYASTRKRVLAA